MRQKICDALEAAIRTRVGFGTRRSYRPRLRLWLSVFVYGFDGRPVDIGKARFLNRLHKYAAAKWRSRCWRRQNPRRRRYAAAARLQARRFWCFSGFRQCPPDAVSGLMPPLSLIQPSSSSITKTRAKLDGSCWTRIRCRRLWLLPAIPACPGTVPNAPVDTWRLSWCPWLRSFLKSSR